MHSTDSRLLQQAANASEESISFEDDDATLTTRLRSLLKQVDDLEHYAEQALHRITKLEETVHDLVAKQGDTAEDAKPSKKRKASVSFPKVSSVPALACCTFEVYDFPCSESSL